VLHSEFVTVSSNSAVQLGLFVLLLAALGVSSAAWVLWQHHHHHQQQFEHLEEQLVGGSANSDSNNGNGKNNRSRKQRPNKQDNDSSMGSTSSSSTQGWVPLLVVAGQLLWVALCGWLAVLAPTLRPVGLHATTTAADRYARTKGCYELFFSFVCSA
jgi:septal ring-binding cell division protein DamX